MKIEEQQASPTTPAGLNLNMAPQSSPTRSGILMGFQEMFQQSLNDDELVSSSSSGGLKRKIDGFSGQESDPFTSSKRVQLMPPNATDETDYDWQYDFNSTIASLNAKHGAIDKDCSLSSKWMIKLNLFGIWGLLKQLEKTRLDELDVSSLVPYYNIIQDAEKQNFNIKWLHDRLDDVRVAVVARHEAKRLQVTKNEQIMVRKQKEEKLNWLQIQAKELEDQVADKDLEIEELTGEITNETAKFQHFENKPLLDGLM